MQQLQTEKVTNVPGGIHDTKECNTPTDSVRISCSVKTCQAVMPEKCYEKWKNPRNRIRRQSELEQTLWGVVFHQSVFLVPLRGKIQEKQNCEKKACFS